MTPQEEIENLDYDRHCYSKNKDLNDWIDDFNPEVVVMNLVYNVSNILFHTDKISYGCLFQDWISYQLSDLDDD